LPKEHQIIIDDDLYNEKIKQITIAKCNHCTTEYPRTDDKTKPEVRPTEHNFQDVRVYQIMIPLIASYISGSEYDKVWNCSKCHKANRLAQTKFIKTALQKPYFLQVVPNPPNRKDGIIDMQTYLKKIRKWVWGFLDELEYQMGEYRRNYVPKNEGFRDHDVNSQMTLDEDLWQ